MREKKRKYNVQIVSKNGCPVCPEAESYFKSNKKFKPYPTVPLESDEGKKIDKIKKIDKLPYIVACSKDGKCIEQKGFNKEFWDSL